jgi:hypothetical protein
MCTGQCRSRTDYRHRHRSVGVWKKREPVIVSYQSIHPKTINTTTFTSINLYSIDCNSLSPFASSHRPSFSSPTQALYTRFQYQDMTKKICIFHHEYINAHLLHISRLFFAWPYRSVGAAAPSQRHSSSRYNIHFSNNCLSFPRRPIPSSLSICVVHTVSTYATLINNASWITQFRHILLTEHARAIMMNHNKCEIYHLSKKVTPVYGNSGMAVPSRLTTSQLGAGGLARVICKVNMPDYQLIKKDYMNWVVPASVSLKYSNQTKFT